MYNGSLFNCFVFIGSLMDCHAHLRSLAMTIKPSTSLRGGLSGPTWQSINQNVILCRFFFGLFLFIVLLVQQPAYAVNPDEVLTDPKLEQRAREISAQLRCLVCQNQSIDDSDAPLARDLRLLVRERLQAGDTDKQVIDFVVNRYGEFALLTPRFSWHTLLLWLSPILFLLFAGLVIGRHLKRQSNAKPKAKVELSDQEKQQLEKLLAEDVRS